MFEVLTYSILFLTLLSASVSDWKTGLIPNRIILSAVVLALALNGYFKSFEGVRESLLSGCFTLILFFLFYLCKGLGAGDVKLMAACSMLTGFWYGLGSVIIASLLAALYGMLIIGFGRGKQFKIPFSVFLMIGYIIYTLIMYH